MTTPSKAALRAELEAALANYCGPVKQCPAAPPPERGAGGSVNGQHDPARALETLVPGEIQALKPGRTRYTLLTNDMGGIRDDLMVTNAGDHLFLIVNASRKTEDFAFA